VDCSAPSPWDCVDVKVPLSGSTAPRRTLGLDQPLRSWRASNGLISVRRPIHRWHTHRARTGGQLEAHGESLVVWIEDEVLGYGGPIQAIARGGQHVLARIRRQPLCFRPPREGPDPSVDVGAFLGRHVERVPAAGLVGVRKITIASCGRIARLRECLASGFETRRARGTIPARTTQAMPRPCRARPPWRASCSGSSRRSTSRWLRDRPDPPSQSGLVRPP
jgi:hypothetical protein